MWQGRERLSDTREIGHEKRLPDAGKFEMQRRLSDAGKGDCHETDGGYD